MSKCAHCTRSVRSRHKILRLCYAAKPGKLPEPDAHDTEQTQILVKSAEGTIKGINTVGDEGTKVR